MYNLMIMHVGKKLSEQFDAHLNKIYGGYGKVKTTRGHVHEYFGITFYLFDKDKVKIDMINYMNAMVDNFIIRLNPNNIIL